MSGNGVPLTDARVAAGAAVRPGHRLLPLLRVGESPAVHVLNSGQRQVAVTAVHALAHLLDILCRIPATWERERSRNGRKKEKMDRVRFRSWTRKVPTPRQPILNSTKRARRGGVGWPRSGHPQARRASPSDKKKKKLICGRPSTRKRTRSFDGLHAVVVGPVRVPAGAGDSVIVRHG